MANPILASDLYQDDGAIKKAIEQLTALAKTQETVLAQVRAEAAKLDSQVKRLNVTTNDNREEIKTTADAAETLRRKYEDQKAAAAGNALELERLKQAQQRLTTEIKLEAKVLDAKEGSYDRLSAQYGLLKQKLNAMSAEERKSTQAGKDMEAQAKAIYNEMKALQEATGKTALNVGNYKEAVAEALAESRNLANQIPGLSFVMGAYEKAVSALTKAKVLLKSGILGTIPPLKLFRIALISTGIGAIVVLLGSLIAAFLSTQRAVDGINRIISSFKYSLQSLLGLLQKVGTELFDRVSEAFRDPVGAIKDLGNAIKEFLLDRLEGFAKFGPAFVKIIKGEFKEGFQDLADAAKQASGVDVLTNAINKAGKAAKDAAVGGFNLGKAIHDLSEEIEDQEIMWETRRESLEHELALQKEIAVDREKSFKERFAANEKAKKLLDEMTQAEVGLAKKRLQLAQMESSASDVSDDRRMELARLQAEVTKVETEAVDRRRGLMLQFNKINKQAETEAKQARKEKESEDKKAQEEEERRLQERQAAITEFEKFRAETIRGRAVTMDEQEAVELAKLDDILAEQRARLEKFGLSTVALEQLIEEERARVRANFVKEREAAAKEQREKDYTAAVASLEDEQALERSKFDLLKTTEAERTRFELEQEKTKLQKMLELNAQYQQGLSALQIETIQNQIKLIDEKLKTATVSTGSIYDLFGLTLEDKEKQVIADSFSFAKQQLDAYFAQRVEQANALVQKSGEQVQAAQQELNSQIELAKLGYANRADQAQKELDLAKANQRKALREQEQAARAQQVIQATLQAGNLITASSKILADFKLPLALVALAVMWGAFATAQLKAASVTKKQFAEGGYESLDYGGSHASGHDIPLGFTKDGKERRVERGESLGIFSRKSVARYGALLPAVVNAINQGTFQQRYAAIEAPGTTIFSGLTVDTATMEKELGAIRRQGEKRIYTDTAGRTVEIFRNQKRTYV